MHKDFKIKGNSYKGDESCIDESLGAMGVFVSETMIFDARISFFADVTFESLVNSCVSFVLILILLHSLDFIVLSSSVLFSIRDTAEGQSSTWSSERI